MKIRTTENKRTIGFEFERETVEFLQEKGYEIVKTNFIFGSIGEIDIIARDKDYLVFIEVKYRKDDKFGSPEYSMTPSKIGKIRRVAEAYLYLNKIQNQNCRFDFIGITKQNNQLNINHIVNAF